MDRPSEEPESVVIELSLDTSRFKRALVNTQFSLMLWGQLTPEQRILFASFNAFWDFDEAMGRVEKMLGDE